jgi:hypothetical protein
VGIAEEDWTVGGDGGEEGGEEADWIGFGEEDFGGGLLGKVCKELLA